MHLVKLIRQVLLYLTLPLGLVAQGFQEPLPIPPLAEGTHFHLRVHDSTHSFAVDTLTGLRTMSYDVTSDSGTYRSSVLGATLNWVRGDSVWITVQNDLPGEETTIHWHGMHVPARWDGGPDNPIAASGGTWMPSFEIMDEACTMWYHPHLHHRTYGQVALGLAGLIRIVDPNEPVDTLLPYHYGIDDIPLVVQDNFMAYDSLQGRDTISTAVHVLPDGTVNTPGFAPNIYLVNGKYQPRTTLPRQVVRFRILDGARTVNFKLAFSAGADSTDQLIPFQVVAADAGYLDSAYTVTSLEFTPGERWEIVLDLGNYNVGDSLTLWTLGAAIPPGINGGPGFGALAGKNVPLCRIEVGPTTTATVPKTSIPATLVPWNPITANASIQREKVLTGDFPNMPLIDSLPFMAGVINDYVFLNSTEEWTIVNRSNEGHPFHIHDSHFTITDTMGSDTTGNGVWVPITAGIYKGPKDVVMVPPDNGAVRFKIQFFDFADTVFKYMYHCHILAHEDQGMMHQFVVWDSAWGMPPYMEFVAVPETAPEANWTLFPNPTEGQLWMQGESPRQSTVRIFDPQGRELTQVNLPPFRGKQALADLSHLPAGVYLVVWDTRNGRQGQRILLR